MTLLAIHNNNSFICQSRSPQVQFKLGPRIFTPKYYHSLIMPTGITV